MCDKEKLCQMLHYSIQYNSMNTVVLTFALCLFWQARIGLAISANPRILAIKTKAELALANPKCSEKEWRKVKNELVSCGNRLNEDFENMNRCELMETLSEDCGNELSSCLDESELRIAKDILIEKLTEALDKSNLAFTYRSCPLYAEYQNRNRVGWQSQKCDRDSINKTMIDKKGCVEQAEKSFLEKFQSTKFESIEEVSAILCPFMDTILFECLGKLKTCFGSKAIKDLRSSWHDYLILFISNLGLSRSVPDACSVDPMQPVTLPTPVNPSPPKRVSQSPANQSSVNLALAILIPILVTSVIECFK